MSTAQTTVQQYEPLRPPANWSAEERRLIQQLTDRFDDLYSRFNRLRFEDLGTKLKQRLSDTEATLEVQADAISAKVDQAQYDAALTLTGSELTVALSRIGDVETAVSDLPTQTDLATQYADFTATAKGFEFRIGSTEGAINDAKTNIGQLQAFKESQESLIYLDDDGVHVGKSDYQAETLVKSNGLYIKDNLGETCAYFINTKSYIKNAEITDVLQVGGFQFVKYDSGRMSIQWAG